MSLCRRILLSCFQGHPHRRAHHQLLDRKVSSCLSEPGGAELPHLLPASRRWRRGAPRLPGIGTRPAAVQIPLTGWKDQPPALVAPWRGVRAVGGASVGGAGDLLSPFWGCAAHWFLDTYQNLSFCTWQESSQQTLQCLDEWFSALAVIRITQGALKKGFFNPHPRMMYSLMFRKRER